MSTTASRCSGIRSVVRLRVESHSRQLADHEVQEHCSTRGTRNRRRPPGWQPYGCTGADPPAREQKICASPTRGDTPDDVQHDQRAQRGHCEHSAERAQDVQPRLGEDPNDGSSGYRQGHRGNRHEPHPEIEIESSTVQPHGSPRLPERSSTAKYRGLHKAPMCPSVGASWKFTRTLMSSQVLFGHINDHYETARSGKLRPAG
jgi:hypothetical protein